MDSSFENKFENITISEGALTLYAKWVEESAPIEDAVINGNGIDVTVDLEFNTKPNNVANASESGIRAQLRVACESFEVEELNDFKLLATVSFEFIDSESAASVPVTASAYVKEGFLYFASPVAQASGKINIEEFVSGVAEMAEEMIPAEYASEEGNVPSEEEIMAIVGPYISKIYPIVSQLNVSEELITNLLAPFALLAPTYSSTRSSFKYEFKQAQLNAFVDAFIAVVKANAADIAMLGARGQLAFDQLMHEFSEEEEPMPTATEEQIAQTAAGYQAMILANIDEFAMIKQAINIKAAKFEYKQDENKAPKEAKLTIDVDAVTEFENDEPVESGNIRFVLTVTFDSFQPTVVYPEFGSEYVDLTEFALSMIGQLASEAMSMIEEGPVLD